jgi:hypothetical protein
LPVRSRTAVHDCWPSPPQTDPTPTQLRTGRFFTPLLMATRSVRAGTLTVEEARELLAALNLSAEDLAAV